MRHVHIALLALSIAVAACAAMPKNPIPTAPQVDLKRFMGPWHVIASIPTFVEKNAYNAVESYELNPDGTIATTFTFHKGSFDGPVKTMKPRGFVKDTAGNARWGMQFIWPIKAEYLIAHVDEQYSETIIARNSRDYVWIMARKPVLEEADYQRLVGLVAAMGYDTAKLVRVPQRWP